MSHRGPHPDDARLFAPEALSALRVAAGEVVWLLDRGYALPGVLTFVGNRHQLEQRPRLALQRSCCSTEALRERQARERPVRAEHAKELSVDAFNLIVLLEVALGGGPLLLGRDGALRDLAGLRGTYHLVEHTEPAIHLLLRTITALAPERVEFLIDAPVSNSGRLRGLLEHCAKEAGLPATCTLVPDADPALSGRVGVVSGDSAVLERAQTWLNLGAHTVSHEVPSAWLLDLAFAS